MKDQSHKRHIAKTLTWRLVGTLDTIVLSWFITGDPLTGLKIGGIEVFSKMLLYYFHERIWFNSKWLEDSQKRHLVKTVVWRCIGTLDTMVIAYIISGNALTGLKIGLTEVITKMVLYYLHERAWYKINFGLIKR
ncbi:DUF2061 domain-containing protein [Mangrovimonas aestuarii]|uniref:DUF2061 domain-containing protein n=1 Tax=Mangrovimonas aestuarii TaxID=3018443 RepID=UPI002378FFB0|nr:DUF2061 domain-containing protein [Mangrovimonas aestuarii]